MARQLRIEYPGAIYHLMNRGDRREPNAFQKLETEAGEQHEFNLK
jgi:hypothetical protein